MKSEYSLVMSFAITYMQPSLVPRPSLTAFFTAVEKSTAAKKAVREGLGTRLHAAHFLYYTSIYNIVLRVFLPFHRLVSTMVPWHCTTSVALLTLQYWTAGQFSEGFFLACINKFYTSTI